MAGPSAGPQITDSPNEASLAPPPAVRPNDSIAAKWGAYLAKPENSAAMMQFGVDMLQPKAMGQSTLGQIGAAVGGGMEARDISLHNQQESDKDARKLAMDSRQLDLSAADNASAADLRSAQAQALRDKPAVSLRDQIGMENLKLNRQKALMKARDDMVKSLINVSPGTPEYNDVVTNIKDIDEELKGGGTAAPADTGGVAAPAAAIAKLKASPDAHHRAFFDKHFGPGAAAKVLGN